LLIVVCWLDVPNSKLNESIVDCFYPNNNQQSTNKCVNIYLALKDISSGLFISWETDDRM